MAFTLIGGKTWTGGYNYLLNLLRVLAQEAPGALIPVLFAGEDVPEPELAPFRAVDNCHVVRDAAFDQPARTGMFLRSLVLGRDDAAWTAVEQQRIDVVFESAIYLGWRLGRPAVAWIPDLQHRLLPHLFGRGAWLKRELGFQAQILSGRTVMCSSEDTQRLCERLYPRTGGRVHAVRFAVSTPKSVPDEHARAVADSYGLPAEYFFMPNQFWAHKNHRLVLDAISLLRTEGRNVCVVASGQQLDPRDRTHVPGLLANIRGAGLESSFRTPGLLPYADLAPLMQASTALLNPSLFEGWSTTVEEAKAAGVPMLLSDLPVHREQAEGDASFFDPRSARALADALGGFRRLATPERAALRAAAAEKSNKRIRRFAEDFVSLIEHACSSRTGTRKS
ncbi:MAG: glycosyltransferase family 4 protein [Rubrivivax sp.]